MALDTIMRHRSIRKYRPHVPLPRQHLEAILEAGRRAPTDATLHLWSAIRVVDLEKRRALAEAIGQEHVFTASEFLVFIADLHRLKRLLEYRGEAFLENHFALLLFAAVDAALAAENMAVAAESLGYGICFIGAVQNDPQTFIRLLGLPQLTYPLFGLTIGIPEEDPPLRPRLPIGLLVMEDRYRDLTASDLEDAYRSMASITRSGDWMAVLRRYVSRDGYFNARAETMRTLMRSMGLNV